MRPGFPEAAYRPRYPVSDSALRVASPRLDLPVHSAGTAKARSVRATARQAWMPLNLSQAAGPTSLLTTLLAVGVLLSPSAGAGPVALAPNPEPGVLVPRVEALGTSTPLQPARPGRGGPDNAASQRELVLDRRHRQLVVLENGTPLRRFPVAVGMPGWETPVGRFAVLEMQINPTWEHPVSGLLIQPGPDNPLGSRWIGFYRDCSGRSGFNGKEHLVVEGCVVAGFHGTPNRSSIGRAASHGCVRLYDEHVRDLFDLVRVGTPVTVMP